MKTMKIYTPKSKKKLFWVKRSKVLVINLDNYMSKQEHILIGRDLGALIAKDLKLKSRAKRFNKNKGYKIILIVGRCGFFGFSGSFLEGLLGETYCKVKQKELFFDFVNIKTLEKDLQEQITNWVVYKEEQWIVDGS